MQRSYSGRELVGKLEELRWSEAQHGQGLGESCWNEMRKKRWTGEDHESPIIQRKDSGLEPKNSGKPSQGSRERVA